MPNRLRRGSRKPLSLAVLHGPGRPRAQHAEVIGRVVRFIDVACARPLSLAELAACAGISERSLHALFCEVFGVSPMRYVRMRKLQMVRHALLEADPTRLTISSVCAQFGWSDGGRVARYYRELFGEYPHETLARKAGPDKRAAREKTR